MIWYSVFITTKMIPWMEEMYIYYSPYHTHTHTYLSHINEENAHYRETSFNYLIHIILS